MGWIVSIVVPHVSTATREFVTPTVLRIRHVGRMGDANVAHRVRDGLPAGRIVANSIVTTATVSVRPDTRCVPAESAAMHANTAPIGACVSTHVPPGCIAAMGSVAVRMGNQSAARSRTANAAVRAQRVSITNAPVMFRMRSAFQSCMNGAGAVPHLVRISSSAVEDASAASVRRLEALRSPKSRIANRSAMTIRFARETSARAHPAVPCAALATTPSAATQCAAIARMESANPNAPKERRAGITSAGVLTIDKSVGKERAGSAVGQALNA